MDRIPAWINYAVQDEGTKSFDGAYVSMGGYEFVHPKPSWQTDKTPLKIYECHVGMAGVDPKIHNFKNFK